MGAQSRGDFATAHAQAEMAVAIDREMGVRGHEAQKLLRLASIGIARGDPATARARLAEALAIDSELGSVAGMADDLELAATIAAEGGNARLSAVLGSVADQLRTRTGNAVLPVDQPSHDACRRRCRDALGDADFDAALATGRAMATDDAVREALRYLGAD